MGVRLLPVHGESLCFDTYAWHVIELYVYRVLCFASFHHKYSLCCTRFSYFWTQFFS